MPFNLKGEKGFAADAVDKLIKENLQDISNQKKYKNSKNG